MQQKPKTLRNELEDLTRRSIRIVKDGLNSESEYERRSTAMSFLIVSAASVLDAPAEETKPDDWADEITDEQEKQTDAE